MSETTTDHQAEKEKTTREVVQDIVDYFRSRPLGEQLDGSRPELPIRADEWAANVIEDVWINGFPR